MRFSSWAGLDASDLMMLESKDIIWEGDVFAPISGANQTFVQNFVANGGGFFGTPERPCCETHNDSLESIIRSITGDNSILIGDLGFDLFDHNFANTPSTILTDPHDITGITIPMDGPGRVLPGDNAPNACFVESDVSNTCTAAAWGPDVLPMSVNGRVVYYGDINSQGDLATQDGGVLFDNVRSFLLTGFSSGGPPQVPVPATLLLISGGGLALSLLARRRKS